jgi:hypothetical protein
MTARNRNGDCARHIANARAGRDVQASSTHTPYWLLWSTAIIALAIGAVAFLLWGVNGASTLFDMILAFCM